MAEETNGRKEISKCKNGRRGKRKEKYPPDKKGGGRREEWKVRSRKIFC